MAEQVHAREHPGRGRRVKVAMTVGLALTPSCKIKAIIEDFSANGFRLRSRLVLHVGQQFTMQMPRGDATCHVRWVDGYRCGGVFEDKIIEPIW